MNDILNRIEILNAHQCKDCCTAVDGAKNRWIGRCMTDAGVPSYWTLGSCVYLDVPNSSASGEYFSAVSESNRFLTSKFGLIYKAIASALEQELEEKVEYTNEYALPGFHVFEEFGLRKCTKSKPHYDLQHMRLKWPEGRQGGKLLSFTLPILLPEYGSGLEVWAKGLERVEQQSRSSWIEEYKIGELVYHNGKIQHRIFASPKIQDSDRRITLQGHGVFISGKWVLYW